MIPNNHCDSQASILIFLRISSQKVLVIQRVGFINYSLLNALKLWCKMKLKHPFVHEVQRFTQAVLLYIFFLHVLPFSNFYLQTCEAQYFQVKPF